MNNQISLKLTEKKVFRLTVADGLWDIFIGFVVLEFSIAPLLSNSLGDFWSSVIFLPVWLLVYIVIRIIRKHVITPRIGQIKLGKPRIKKLIRFSIIMLVINLVAFILGIVVFQYFDRLSGGLISGIFGLVILSGFCLAGYLLDYPRLYLYGSLLLIAPMIGEWLYAFHGASHHGFPIVFGISSGIIIMTGLVTFFRLLKKYPRLEIPEGS